MNLIIEAKSKPGNFQELYQALQALLPASHREYRVHRDGEGGEILSFSVHWENQTAFEHYIRSNSGSALLGAMELLCETVRIKLDQDLPWEGIDTLKRIREQV